VTELVLFDLDGVLVDSEPISTRVLMAVLAEVGLPMDGAAAEQRFLGRSRGESVAFIEQQLGRAVPQDFVANWQAQVFAAFRQELKPVPGIAAALDQLTVPFCVASGSDPARIQLSLELAGLLPRFEGRIFSAAQVARGKPAPDLFLFAARSLGAAPARCVVVEDSLPGVQAAVAAGMPVLGYAARNPAALLAQAGAITFDDMTRLPGLIEQLSIATASLPSPGLPPPVRPRSPR
jgi:HAD superfamily hydrolase (TIGR01509 family)